MPECENCDALRRRAEAAEAERDKALAYGDTMSGRAQGLAALLREARPFVALLDAWGVSPDEMLARIDSALDGDAGETT